jgi:hypothetical protein
MGGIMEETMQAKGRVVMRSTRALRRMVFGRREGNHYIRRG